jgi:acyl-CoA reductase-like NAD-dependent aldehyde dehydrogenase
MVKFLRPFIHRVSTATESAAPTITLLNPANATPHAHYQPTSLELLTHALEQSTIARGEWAKTSPSHRAAILRQTAEILSQNVEQFSRLETIDTGRPIRETEYDVLEGIECLHYYASVLSTNSGEMYQFDRGNWGYTTRIPLGVTLGIGAWNYPLQGCLWKAVPALAFGNSMIFKPSEFTPSSALALGECLVEAGLPEGLFQVCAQ